MEHFKFKNQRRAKIEAWRQVEVLEKESKKIAFPLLGIFASLTGALVVTSLWRFGSTLGINIPFVIWIPFGLGAAAAVLSVVFILVLRREPSKVLQLKQRLVSAYIDHLSESIKGSGVAGSA